jgi:hypothetical protein
MLGDQAAGPHPRHVSERGNPLFPVRQAFEIGVGNHDISPFLSDAVNDVKFFTLITTVAAPLWLWLTAGNFSP